MSNKKGEISEALNFVVTGGKLLLLFVMSLAFWLLLFYKVGVVWTAILFILHELYEKLEEHVYGR